MSSLAVVTGASSGIGAAYASRLASDGFDLLVVARRRDRLDDLAKSLGAEHGVDVSTQVADLGKPDDLRLLGERIESSAVDLLVNNAGLAYYMPFADLPPEEARELVDVNVVAPVLLSRAAVSGMVTRRSGAIINVASLLAFSGSVVNPLLPERAVYASTKSFLVTFSQVLAREVAEAGVRVQVVCPGIVRSEFHSRQGMDFTNIPRMEPELVVEASLTDLERGVVVSVPGLGDESMMDRANESSGALTAFARATELPPRYSSF